MQEVRKGWTSSTNGICERYKVLVANYGRKTALERPGLRWKTLKWMLKK
jgi:hypothetical protein